MSQIFGKNGWGVKTKYYIKTYQNVYNSRCLNMNHRKIWILWFPKSFSIGLHFIRLWVATCNDKKLYKLWKNWALHKETGILGRRSDRFITGAICWSVLKLSTAFFVYQNVSLTEICPNSFGFDLYLNMPGFSFTWKKNVQDWNEIFGQYKINVNHSELRKNKAKR